MTACGISVIGSCVGGYYKFFTDGKDSILIENGKLDNVVFALKRILAMGVDDISKMKRNVRITSVEKFDFRAYSDTFKAFLDNGINI